MLLRRGETLGPWEYYYPAAALRRDAATTGGYNMRVEKIGGKRRRVTAGEVSPQNVDMFVKSMARMGFLKDNRKRRA